MNKKVKLLAAGFIATAMFALSGCSATTSAVNTSDNVANDAGSPAIIAPAVLPADLHFCASVPITANAYLKKDNTYYVAFTVGEYPKSYSAKHGVGEGFKYQFKMSQDAVQRFDKVVASLPHDPAYSLAMEVPFSKAHTLAVSSYSTDYIWGTWNSAKHCHN